VQKSLKNSLGVKNRDSKKIIVALMIFIGILMITKVGFAYCTISRGDELLQMMKECEAYRNNLPNASEIKAGIYLGYLSGVVETIELLSKLQSTNPQGLNVLLSIVKGKNLDSKITRGIDYSVVLTKYIKNNPGNLSGFAPSVVINAVYLTN
jgi:hypothetical protein